MKIKAFDRITFRKKIFILLPVHLKKIINLNTYYATNMSKLVVNIAIPAMERHFISPYYKIQWNGIGARNLDLIFRIDKVEQCP